MTSDAAPVGRIPARGAIAGAMMLALWLAGCGTDTSRTEGTRIALGVVQGIKQKVVPGKSAAPADVPDPEKLAASAMASFKGPLILAQIEKAGLLTALGETGRNGASRTFATPNEQTLVLRNGILTATRGLGDDLMSADTAQAASLILRRESGSANRTYRYLDGEGIERPLPMQCTVTAGPAKSFDFAGRHYDTRQMDESCRATAAELTVSNSYWVTSDGTVALSRQWIGPALGHLTIQLVRP
ncbi:MAG: YjbF family lipoprotein [Albidovulum sp.]